MRKRITSLLLAACLLLCLAACGNTPESSDTPDDEIGDIAANTLSPASPSPKATEKPEATSAPEPSPSASPAQTAAPTPVVPTPVATPIPSEAPSGPLETETPESPSVTESPGNEEGGAGTESPEPSEGAGDEAGEDGVDLQSFYDTVSSTYEFTSMMDMDSEMMDAYYPGLSAVSKTQFVGKIAMITASANEIVLIECENSDDVETVRAILQARKQTQVDGGAWYPESITMWESARICVNGNFLMLVSHSSAADIAASFDALFTE